MHGAIQENEVIFAKSFGNFANWAMAFDLSTPALQNAVITATFATS